MMQRGGGIIHPRIHKTDPYKKTDCKSKEPGNILEYSVVYVKLRAQRSTKATSKNLAINQNSTLPSVHPFHSATARAEVIVALRDEALDGGGGLRVEGRPVRRGARPRRRRGAGGGGGRPLSRRRRHRQERAHPRPPRIGDKGSHPKSK